VVGDWSRAASARLLLSNHRRLDRGDPQYWLRSDVTGKAPL